MTEHLLRSSADMPQSKLCIHDIQAERRVLDQIEEGVAIATQLLFGPVAFGNVFEADTHAVSGCVLDPKRMQFQHAPLRNQATLELDRLAGLEHSVVGQQPFLGFVWKHFAHCSPDHAAKAGLQLERRVGFDIAKVQWLARFALNLLDDAEAIAYRFENRAVAFFAVPSRIDGLHRQVGRRCEPAQALELPQVFGVELAAGVVGHGPDRADQFAANLKGDQQALCNRRQERQQIRVAPFGVLEQHRCVAIEHVATRAKVSRRTAADMRLPQASDGRPIEPLAVLAQQADAGRVGFHRNPQGLCQHLEHTARRVDQRLRQADQHAVLGLVIRRTARAQGQLAREHDCFERHGAGRTRFGDLHDCRATCFLHLASRRSALTWPARRDSNPRPPA